MIAEAVGNPFVGLRPFESDESLLFFGRQEQTLQLLQRLHEHHFVAVIGSSGSGKSSLTRAGLIPRLQAGYLVNDNDRWVITIMKPGQTPICNLADALLTDPLLANGQLTSTQLEQKIKEEGADAVLDLLAPLWENKTNFFLLVDQFEELFRFSFHQNDFDKKDEAKDFVNILLALAEEKDLPIYVVTTMRSDFIGDCALIYGLPEAMNKSQYIVPRLNRQQLRNAIEGPVRLYRGKIHAALTARLLNDAQLINDELPLLQHALMRIWNFENTEDKNGELDLADYEEIGGIEKALSNHADEALQGMTPEQTRIAKKLFQSLTTVDENGRKIRRPARLSELVALTGGEAENLRSIITRFNEGNRSFLVINKIPNTDDLLLDISHESLIRQWHTLTQWVEEESEAVRKFQRLTDSARLYEGGTGDLLAGNELQTTLQWFSTFNPDPSWARRYYNDAEKTIGFLHESEKEWQALQREKEKQQQQKRRTRRLLLTGLVVIILLISAFAYWIYQRNAENKQQLAQNYWNTSQAARAKGDLLGSLLYAAQALALSDKADLKKNLLTDSDPLLPPASLQQVFTIPDYIASADFDATGKRIALAGADGLVRIIDISTGKPSGPAMEHEALVHTARFSKNGQELLTASNDFTARLWNIATRKNGLRLKHTAAVISAVFSPDETMILTACEDGNAYLWEKATGKEVAALPHDAKVLDAAFSPDGKWILTACEDGTARLWETDSQKRLTVFQHNSRVTVSSFTKPGGLIFTISADSTVRLWEPLKEEAVLVIKNTSSVIHAAVSPDGQWLVIGGGDGYARFWNIAEKKQIGSELKHDGSIVSIAFAPDGKQLLTTGWDKAVRLWQRPEESNAVQDQLFAHTAAVNAAFFNQDGTKIVTASNDATAIIWNTKRGKKEQTLQHTGVVVTADFSPDGNRVVTTANGSPVTLWDVASGRKTDSFTIPDVLSNTAFFSADGRQIITTNGEKIIYRLDGASLQLLDSFSYQLDNVYANVKKAILSKDGKTILVAGSDSVARLLDVATKEEKAVFPHQDEVNSAVFSPDGKTVLTASSDGTARLWDIALKRQVGPAMKHNGYVQTAFFSSDGKWIVTATSTGEVQLWEAGSLRQIALGSKLAGGANSTVFSPDGTKLLAAGINGTTHLWEIPADLDIPSDLFHLQAKALSGAELNLVTGETQCIGQEQWALLKQDYETKAREHYRDCKYTAHNLWRRFHAKEAEDIRTVRTRSP